MSALFGSSWNTNSLWPCQECWETDKTWENNFRSFLVWCHFHLSFTMPWNAAGILSLFPLPHWRRQTFSPLQASSGVLPWRSFFMCCPCGSSLYPCLFLCFSTYQSSLCFRFASLSALCYRVNLPGVEAVFHDLVNKLWPSQGKPCSLSGQVKSLKERLTLSAGVHEPIYGAVQKYHCSSQQPFRKPDDEGNYKLSSAEP